MTVYSDVDARFLEQPERLGSSLRHRRLAIAGHVLFDPVALARPSMRPKKIALLTTLLRDSTNVLEFGAGGSTALALKLGVKRVVSVESDPEWIARIKADDAAARAIEDGRLSILHADIGAIGIFGGPKRDGDKANWPNYARAPWGHLDPDDLDLVLVDGRFRVACLAETIRSVSRKTLIAVHDFSDRRYYHAVLPFLQEVGRRQTLCVFRVRADLDGMAAKALADRAAYWPQ